MRDRLAQLKAALTRVKPLMTAAAKAELAQVLRDLAEWLESEE